MLMKEKFIEKSEEMLSDAYDYINSLSMVNAESFDYTKTAVVIVDVINGFINEGALHDKNISRIILPIKKLIQYSLSKRMPVVAFADCHNEKSAEFSAFPVHCLKGGSESEVVDELKNIGGYTLIEKNSTNGFHAPEFQRFLTENVDIDSFIVCGDCTDICVMNFCLTLKTYFDQHDKKCRITVPVNMIETFDSESHYNEFMNAAAIMLMKNAGIELAGGIDFD